ncbi:MAG TPA: SulP family inorganic anion transporter [Gaiellaceae bacterium]
MATPSRLIGQLTSFARSVAPDRRTLARDAVAGVPGAIGSVPDGMAASVLVGVSPIHGLYASFAGPIAGGLTASTRLMVITTTSAAALAAGSALTHVSSGNRSDALIVLTLMAGAFMVVAGVLRLGRFARFVSISVMLGFLTGVAANIICGQLPDLTGAPSHGRVALGKALNVVIHPHRIEWQSLLVGLSALVIMIGLARTRLRAFSSLVAIVLPTVLTIWLSGVASVSDAGTIPTGIPLPHLPRVGVINFDLITGALAVAVIVLVQGVGVSEAAPNRDGIRADANRDFVAQGVGNLASGFFRGQPVGGSVGQTALNLAAGARTRWASIFSGIWMLAILVLFAGVVGKVALPTLAAILIYAASTSLRFGELTTIWRTGLSSQIALATTFLATLFLPVSAAVGVGLALSLLLQLNREALDLSVVELVPQPDGRLVERPPPAHLPSNAVTALDVYGSLFYAGARTLEARLPDPVGSDAPLVVLRLRGRTSLGATGLAVLAEYGERLTSVGGQLYLSGVDAGLVDQLRRSGRIDERSPVHVFPATEVVGESTTLAYSEAETWLVERRSGIDSSAL